MTARNVVSTLAWCLACALWTAPGAASASTSKTAAQPGAKAPAKPKPKSKPASQKPASKAGTGSSTRARAPASPRPTPGLSEAQLSAAEQVLTGQVDCEFEQTVVVERHATLIGSFQVRHKNRNYLMVPEETSTGAVRLIDPKAGVVWLQIPVKSMMMNARAGRRMVDACTHPLQRQALAEEEAQQKAAALAATLPAGSPTVSQTVQVPESPPVLPQPLLLAPADANLGTAAQGTVPAQAPTPR